METIDLKIHAVWEELERVVTSNEINVKDFEITFLNLGDDTYVFTNSLEPIKELNTKYRMEEVVPPSNFDVILGKPKVLGELYMLPYNLV